MASARPTIGLALIARDEADALPALLATCSGAFDEVVLVDTGSRDRTVARFRAWADTQPSTTCRIERFEWCDDFAAARQQADDLLGTGWKVWADCDDEIVGAPNLRGLAAAAPPDVAAYRFGYDIARDGFGNCTCYTHRERMVRAGRGRWAGRVHEVQVIDGNVAYAGAEVAEWVHHRDRKPSRPSHSPRPDIRILTDQLKGLPDDPRTVFYLAQSHADMGEYDRALELYDQRVGLGGWPEEVFMSHLRSGRIRADRGDWSGGLQSLLRAWECRPDRVEPLYEMAVRMRLRGENLGGQLFARRGLDRPCPRQALFLQPWIYEWGVLYEYAVTSHLLDDVDEAGWAGERLLGIPRLPDSHRAHIERLMTASSGPRRGAPARVTSPAWDRQVPELIGRWACTPGSAEPLLSLATGYRRQGQMAPARLFAERGLAVAADSPRSQESPELIWGLELELAIAAFWTGDTQASLDACSRLLSSGQAPAEMQRCAQAQYDLGLRRQRSWEALEARSAGIPNYVVMPVRGREDLTVAVLADLVTQGGAERIFVYDNEGSLVLDGRFQGVEVIPSVGRSIHQMWNAGVSTCLERSPVCNIAVLNNDLLIGPSFLVSLARALRSDDSLVAVSPDYDGRSVPGTVQRVRGIAGGVEDGSGGLAGFAFMVRGESFTAGLPRFDEQFEFWFGDNDFVDSVEEFGGSCGVTSLTSVVHIGGGSQTTGGRHELPAHLRAAIERDRDRYRRKRAALDDLSAG